MKKYFLLTMVLGGLLTISGCAVKNRVAQNAWGNGRNFATSTQQKFDFPKGAVSDLVVGKNITVMGVANSDGSISASQIMIGDMPGFGGQGMGNRNGTSSPMFNTSSAPQMPAGQNQTGERRQFQGGERQGDRSGGNPPGGVQRNRAGGRVVGEIMKVDAIALIVKLTDGGSKIIFYTDKTEIFLIPNEKDRPLLGKPTSSTPIGTTTTINTTTP